MRIRSVLLWLLVLALLVPAAALTLTRAFEPAGSRWVQLEAFTPLALVPYAALALGAGAVTWRRRHAAAAGLAMVAVAGLGLHGWWFAPMLTGANPPAPGDAETLTVMTANLKLGGADGIALVETASEEGVDILVVQEVTAPVLADMERAGLDALFDHRAGEPRQSAHGTMVFANVELTDATRVGTTWDSWLMKAGDISLLAVHPHAPTDAERWRDDHALISETVTAERPDLVVGDLNATPDHVPMRDLAEAGWRSATELGNHGWQPTWSPAGLLGGLPVPPLVHIDHVLLGRTLAAGETRTVEVEDSDHRALVAEVAVK